MSIDIASRATASAGSPAGSRFAAKWRLLRRTVPTLGILGVLACSNPSPDTQIEGPWAADRTERGDTSVVRTLSGSVWGDTLRLVPDLMIGELEGQTPYVFGRITSIDIDDAGNIVVVDHQAIEIRVFDERGHHLRTFGRRGEGPGEFRSPGHARFLPDGRIVVRDPPFRFLVFTDDGVPAGEWRLETGFVTNRPFFLMTDRTVLDHASPESLIAYELTGQPVDTVPTPSLGHDPERIEISGATYEIPFVPREHWTFDDRGRALIGLGHTYRIDRRDSTGMLRIERQAGRPEVLPEERAWHRSRLTESIQRHVDPEWDGAGAMIPRTKPYFKQIIAGADGSIWVIRYTSGVRMPNPAWNPSDPNTGPESFWVDGTVVADVFDEDGRFMGPVELPQGLLQVPPVVTTAAVWGVVPDSTLGHQRVVRFRLEPDAHVQ